MRRSVITNPCANRPRENIAAEIGGGRSFVHLHSAERPVIHHERCAQHSVGDTYCV